MNNQTPATRIRNLVARLLAFVMVFNGLSIVVPSLTPVRAQEAPKRIIIVNADQPNVWTLEQAHYLLAQMHRRSLDLKAKKLEALDPNAINGLRFELLQTLVEAGVSFKEGDAFTNKQLKDQKEFNAQRRPQLISERDKLSQESIQLERDLADLRTKKANATSQEEKERLDAEIAAKTTLLAKVDKEIELRNNELKTLGDGSGEFKSTEAQVQFDKNKFPKSVFEDAFKATTTSLIDRFNQSPSLNASLMLENTLQMQYEIISKQLTLLRDEVGPGERLLFLELPQTVNVAHGEANNKWAQSWWRIKGYTWREMSDAMRRKEASDSMRRDHNRVPIKTAEDYNSILDTKQTEDRKNRLQDEYRDKSDQRAEAEFQTRFADLDDVKPLPELVAALEGYPSDYKKFISNRLVRTVELIPRQSSLNVNDIDLRTKAGAFSAVASFLFGFGARLNIQRQREQFSQFVQQELYSSAFGKGSREFGWTFTPMPGADRLLSGVRTTYAAVIVPDNATSLVVESNGCYFPRTAPQPGDFADTRSGNWTKNRTSRNCGAGKVFVVPIPIGGMNGRNDFWVEGISFQPVAKGKSIVVLVSGKNFSPQTGVLINGVPLVHAIGLAQPLIRDDSEAGRNTAEDMKNVEIPGRIERVDSNKIVFSFKMPTDFEGTPTITLISPGKAIDLNWLAVRINDKREQITLKDYSPVMFGAPRAFRIDNVTIFRSPTSDKMLRAQISGAGFENGARLPRVLVNGSPQTSVTFESPTLLTIEFPAPADEKIQFTLVSKNTDPKEIEATESVAIANPAFPGSGSTSATLATTPQERANPAAQTSPAEPTKSRSLSSRLSSNHRRKRP